MTQTVGIIRVILVANKFSRFSIKSIESSIRPNPEHTRLVFIDWPDTIAAQAVGIIGIVLVMGKSSRFYKRLVYEEQIATDVGAYYSPGEIGLICPIFHSQWSSVSV